MENIASSKLRDAEEPALESIALALQDEEIRKAKRSRNVLKAAEKLVAIVAIPPSPGVLRRLNEVKDLSKELEESESGAMRNAYKKLQVDISKKMDELVAAKSAVETSGEQGQDSAKAKKKKKKKKK